MRRQRTEHLGAEHSPEAVRRRLTEPPRQSYLPDYVYGAIDGIVTTFAVVSGAAGATLRPAVVIILGVATSSRMASAWRSATTSPPGPSSSNRIRQGRRKSVI